MQGDAIKTTIEWFTPELRQPEKSGFYITTTENRQTGNTTTNITYYRKRDDGGVWDYDEVAKVIFWSELPTMPQKETLN